jgi:hypothetical protein
LGGGGGWGGEEKGKKCSKQDLACMFVTFLQSYLKTFVLDELFNSVNNIKLPVSIKISEISCVYPTLLIYGEFGGLWIVVIT